MIQFAYQLDAERHLRGNELSSLAERMVEAIEADIVAGRFGATGKRADEDFEAGRCTPL